MSEDVRTAELRAKNVEMAERLGVALWDLEVVAITDLAPSMREITFRCLEPHEPDFAPGNDLTLSIATRDDAVVRRRYSIRRLDRERRLVDLQFVLHGDGPAGRWAAGAQIGDRIEGVGPRGKIVVSPDASWHLFAADDAFIPAASVMIESLPADATAFVYFEVDGTKDELPFAAVAQLRGPGYLHRDGVEPGTSSVLADALGSFTPPPGPGAAYLGGEHRITNALRRILVDRGIAAEAIFAKPYWRLGRPNADHGEPPREE
jgi:NADPH-dependent ferric siderophore reductase